MKKHESGRSMVEMLGVLAIIGVLSVGGIAGYSLSMRRHRANAVVDAVSKFSTITYGECQQRIMNGEATPNSGCGTNDLKNRLFTDTDLGQLPTGVVRIFHWNVEHDKTTGVDTVYSRTIFSDQKLCQAVASIVGENCTDNYIDIKIKQN